MWGCDVKRADLLISVIFFVMGTWVLWQATMLPQFSVFGPGPDFMPNVLGVLLLILSSLLFVSTVRKAAAAGESLMPDRQGLYRIVVVVVALFLYTALLDAVGYLVLTFAYSLLMLAALGKYRWYVSLALAAVITFTFYWSFVTLLGVPAPKGIFSL